MLKTIKPTKMRISRSLSNPLRTIGHIWPVFTVLYISLNISRSWLLFFKNNPIFDISGKFAIEWWCSYWFLVKNSQRKALLKMTKILKKMRFFENLIVLKGLIECPNLRKALKNVWKCKIQFNSMLKTIKATKMRILRSLSNPLRTIGHIWPVFYRVVHIAQYLEILTAFFQK